MQIDTLRPVSVRFAGAATAVPSGTLATVTADNSDATYIDMNVASSGSNWSLRVGSHTPPTFNERHQIRGRIRIRTDSGEAVEDIDLGRGELDYIAYETVPATTTVTERFTAWSQHPDYGLDTVGALADLNIGGGWPVASSGSPVEIRTMECYVDIDCRFAPDYAPEIRDNAGVDQSGGLVTDTDQPTLYFGGVSYDGLPPLDWQVTLNGALISSGSGAPPTQVAVTTGLDDGAYTATFTVRSTIRGSDPFENTESLAFTVQNTVPSPSPPIMTVRREFGGYRVTWNDPGGQAWDDDYVVAEVWREDCFSNQRIATVPGGLNGSYLDLAIPQLDPRTVQTEDGCEVQTSACDITYSVRYWGYVSTTVELPDTIPAEMILAWPGTVGTIPSGWTRVTALDGVFPRGATTTGVPSATGGAATHSHTTPGHTHSIAAHAHGVAGSTGSSGSSTTSARFNGASQPQADQPHTHTRPTLTGTAGAQNSSSTAPGTSTANNAPPAREVIWISSDGAQVSYPVGVLGWATESVSGWTDDAASSGLMLKGAPAAGNGGATTGTLTHTHSVSSHTHNGFSHDHSLGSTGLSNPSSSQEAGTGSSTPRWLPRHTHPMDVINASTGNTTSVGGGNTNAANLEPPNRRLRVLRNTGGGTQTRIIGLYAGDVAGLDPLLTLCDGANGTPDMRTLFCRDVGGNSVNSVGGAETHSHTTPNHTHDIGDHNHDTTVGVSTTGSFERPTSGDLGDSPTTGHTHSSGNTANTSPAVSSQGSGVTSTASHVPPYREMHFVRLDGTISGGPLPVPELKVSDYATVTVPSFLYGDELDRLATTTEIMAVLTDRSSVFPRLVTDSIPLDGGLHTVSTTVVGANRWLIGEDLTLIIGVEGFPAINRLEALLSSDRVYFSPVSGLPGWFAPSSWTVTAPAPDVKVLTVVLVRQPWPATPEPGEFL